MAYVVSKPTIDEAVDVIFSHNEEVRIWKSVPEDNASTLEWEGMAHKIPAEYADVTNWRIVGLIPESVCEAVFINILIG